MTDAQAGALAAAALGTLSALAVAALVMGLAGCGAAPSPLDEAYVGVYGSAQQVCVAHAADKAQADACRDDIKTLFCGDGGPLAEAGACFHVTMSDGGFVR